MNITGKENDLLKSLAASYAIPKYDPSKHVTSKSLADEIGVDPRTALNYLDNEYENGKIQRERIRLSSGHLSWGYFSLNENTAD